MQIITQKSKYRIVCGRVNLYEEQSILVVLLVIIVQTLVFDYVNKNAQIYFSSFGMPLSTATSLQILSHIKFST